MIQFIKIFQIFNPALSGQKSRLFYYHPAICQKIHIFSDFFSKDSYFAGIQFKESHHTFKKYRFSGTVSADDSINSALFQSKRYIRENFTVYQKTYCNFVQ